MAVILLKKNHKFNVKDKQVSGISIIKRQI